jgi:hypothetical protein
MSNEAGPSQQPGIIQLVKPDMTDMLETANPFCCNNPLNEVELECKEQLTGMHRIRHQVNQRAAEENLDGGNYQRYPPEIASDRLNYPEYPIRRPWSDVLPFVQAARAGHLTLPSKLDAPETRGDFRSARSLVIMVYEKGEDQNGKTYKRCYPFFPVGEGFYYCQWNATQGGLLHDRQLINMAIVGKCEKCNKEYKFLVYKYWPMGDDKADKRAELEAEEERKRAAQPADVQRLMQWIKKP